jgi:hypothetical protein
LPPPRHCVLFSTQVLDGGDDDDAGANGVSDGPRIDEEDFLNNVRLLLVKIYYRQNM